MGRNWLQTMKTFGPGFAVAATGVGAGDFVAASVAGARFGLVVLWAGVFGAVIKYVLNEGISRWQLATGSTILEGWVTRFHPSIAGYFTAYLVLWSVIVAAALASACGLAAHAIHDGLSVNAWAVVHSVVCAGVVLYGRYRLFEQLMKILIGIMVVSVVTCAVMVKPDLSSLLSSLFVPVVPAGSGKFLLGVIGGVGGSVTLLSYGYWIKEKRWNGPESHRMVRADLGLAYFFTGLFAAALIVIAEGVRPEVVMGERMALEVAKQIEAVIGRWGTWVFLLGFWGAVFTSMLGVWQGIPYLFTDIVQTYKRSWGKTVSEEPGTTSLEYRVYLFFLAFPPLLLLFVGKPVWIIVIYAIIGSFFMPFLAIMLLLMNNREEWVGQLKNGWMTNWFLVLSLIVFGYLCYEEIVGMLN